MSKKSKSEIRDPAVPWNTEDPEYSHDVVDEKRQDPGDAHVDTAAPSSLPPDAGAQSSSKTGKQSSAKKMDDSRHNLAPIPATKPVPGAHGKEPNREK